MKKIYNKTIALIILIIAVQSFAKAQCISTSLFGGATMTSTVPGQFVTGSTCNYGGEYAPITFSVTGVFSFSTNVATDYITITDNSNNIVAFGLTPLMSVNIPSVGVYRFHISASGPPACTTQNTCRSSVVFVPLPNCTGAPTAGTVPASFSICPNSSAVITATGATAATGITYQWQQAASAGGPWTNVTTGTGFNSTSLTTATLSTQTYYQMVVTCTTSALSATSSVLSVNPNNPFTLCYCNLSLGGSGCSGDYITNISVFTTPLNNTSVCNSTPLNGTYSLFNPGAGTTATLNAGASYSISVNTTANNIISVWIDYNHSGTFDVSEHTQICTTSTPSLATVAVINIPASSLTGPTGMRIRSRATGNTNGPGDACTNFGSGECEDYVVTIGPGVICSGAPASNTVTSNVTSICPGLNANLGLLNTYTVSGLTFQWASATSSVGPYTSIPGATITSYNTPTLSSTTWYQCVITCTAGPASTTATPIGVNVVVTTTNTVPYFEGFEGIGFTNQLPNCSWTASSPTTICQTYTASGTYNRVPHTGSKFASFMYNSSVNGEYFYSSGILLNAGTTYSANAFYITDGINGWNEFSLLFGTTQSTVGLTNIATVLGPITNTTYASLGGAFTVPTTGIYYIAVKNIGSFPPWYFSWDDLSVVALPACSGTPASNSVVATTTSICSGGSTNLSLATTYTTGGLTYQWSTATSSVGPYTSIPGATLSALTQTGITTSIWYNCVITCTAGPASTTATPIQISVLGAPVYATVPFLENFDNAWQNRCDIRNVPVSNNWNSYPTTGNASWRRQDDGLSANWTAATSFTVAPLTGAGCANFHTWYALPGDTGTLDLYVNLNSSSTYSVSFYYNNASGSDSLEVFLSNNGGTSFAKKGGYLVDPTWSKKTILLTGVSSPSCILRFTATSDYGASDIGIDSLQISSSCTNPTVVVSSSSSSICIGSSAVLTASGSTTYSWNTGATTSSISVTPTVTTSYTVVGSVAGGCSDTKTINVNVTPLPTLTTAATATAICSGQSATITAGGASNYTWTPGALTTSAIVVSPTINVTYTVVGGSGTCTNTSVQSMSVKPTPNITISPVTATICSTGGSATLSATGGSSYSWTPANFAGPSNIPTVVVSPTVNTIYSVSSTNTVTGCVGVKTVSVNIINCVGIFENSSVNERTTVYPNPTNGIVTIMMENNSGTYSFEVLDVTGKLVYKNNLAKAETQVNIKDLANGLYTYRITSIVTKQIIKQGKLVKE